MWLSYVICQDGFECQQPALGPFGTSGQGALKGNRLLSGGGGHEFKNVDIKEVVYYPVVG